MSTNFLPGTVLHDRYTLVRLLGAGGMGAVYLARDLILDRIVALKANPSDDPASQRQFLLEARILAGLSHPNLPRVTDYFQMPTGQCLVMDYVEGESLGTLVHQRGALPQEVAVDWIIQILDAVQYLHSKGIIHRDIKPQNIIIRPDGKAILVDFGIAKALYRTPRTTFFARSTGTPGYASPEQYTGGTDERSDIYSLGATLYYLVTAHDPLESPIRAAGGTLPRPRQITNSISPSLEEVILTAMKLDASKRFATATNMCQALLASSSRKVPQKAEIPTRAGPVERFPFFPKNLGYMGLIALSASALSCIVIAFCILRFAIIVLSPREILLPDVQPFSERNIDRIDEIKIALFGGKRAADIVWSADADTLFLATLAETCIYEWDPLVETRCGVPWLSKQADVSFSPSGRFLTQIKPDRTLEMWSQRNGGKYAEPRIFKGVRRVLFSPDEQLIALNFSDGSLLVGPVQAAAMRKVSDSSENVTAWAFSSNSQFLAFADDDNKSVKITDIRHSDQTTTLGYSDDPIRAIAFGVTDQWVAAAGEGQFIKVWNVENPKQVRTLEGKITGISAISFLSSERGSLLAAAEQDGNVQIWDIEKKRVVRTLVTNQGELTRIRFSPDGRWFVTVGQDNTLKFWGVRQ